MSITTLTRTDQVHTRPMARAPRVVPVAPTKKPRRPRRRRRYDDASARYDDASTVTNPRVIDLQIRSVALWPRAYR